MKNDNTYHTRQSAGRCKRKQLRRSSQKVTGSESTVFHSNNGWWLANRNGLVEGVETHPRLHFSVLYISRFFLEIIFRQLWELWCVSCPFWIAAGDHDVPRSRAGGIIKQVARAEVAQPGVASRDDGCAKRGG